MEGEKTVLVKAQSKSHSLRTTVPSTVVKQFGLHEGSKLFWKFKDMNKKILVVQAKK